MRHRWLLFVLEGALLSLSVTAAAVPAVSADCGVEVPALLFRLDGGPWPEPLAEALWGQLSVEADRLGLVACQSSRGPALAMVAVTLEDQALILEVSAEQGGVERRLRRVLGPPREGAPEYPAELAIVIGELVREVLRTPPPPPPPPVVEAVAPPPPPPPRRWGLGARGLGELSFATSTAFLGVDLSLRRRLEGLFTVEVYAAWRRTPVARSALGTIEASAYGGGAALALPLLGDQRLAFSLEGGARVLALHFSGEAGASATLDEGWGVSAQALAGLGLDYAPSLGSRIVLRAGAGYGLRGVTARSETEGPLSNRGLGVYLSVGGEGWL